jgi:hypothetical protein
MAKLLFQFWMPLDPGRDADSQSVLAYSLTRIVSFSPDERTKALPNLTVHYVGIEISKAYGG